jgi:hypothetical protein
MEFVDVGRERSKGKLRKVILVHGEPGPQKVLTELLGKQGMHDVVAPASGDRISL